MPTTPSPSRSRRIVAISALLLFVAMVTTTGIGAAHNPACHQTAGADGPHYDDDETTGSEIAFDKNPTLGGEFNENAPGSCSVGNSQSPHSDN